MELTNTKYKLTEVGLIPEDWDSTSLKECCVKIQDGNYGESYPKQNEFISIGIPFLTSKAIGKDGILIESKIDFISNEKHNLLQKAHLSLDDVLFTNRGASVGAIGYVDKRICHGNIGPQLTLLRSKSDIIYPKFLFHAMKSDYVSNQIKSNDSGSAMNFFGLGETSKFSFPLPPTLTEQKAIATALSETDELISNLEQLIAKKKAIKQGAMQQLLTPPHKGGKRLEGFDGEWNYISIDELCKTFTKQTGFDYSNHIKPVLLKENRRETLPFIQNKDFDGIWVNYNTDYYIPKEVAERFPRILLNERCLMISISGSIGKVGVFNNLNTAFIGGAVAVGKFKNKEVLDWVMFYLQSERGQAMLLKDVKAGSHQNLILDDIRKMNIPIPPLDEQKSIVAMLKNMELEILKLSDKKAKYEQIKQGMMQELLTGKTRLV